METRELEVQIGWTVMGRTTIQVPAHLSLEEAIRYAEENIQTIKNPYETAVYLPDSDFIEESGCRWKEKIPQNTEKKLNSVSHKAKSLLFNEEKLRNEF